MCVVDDARTTVRLDRAAADMIEHFGGITLHDMLSQDPDARPLCDAGMSARAGKTLGRS